MDLTELTPFPWEQDETWLVSGRGKWPDGTVRTLREQPGFAKFNSQEDAAFAALASHAFDVLMRHPDWHLFPADRHGVPGWRVCVCVCWDQYDPIVDGVDWPDPFTALCAADEWYKANVEGVS